MLDFLYNKDILNNISNDFDRTLGIFISFFVVVIFFLIYTINNIWIYVGFLIFAEILLLKNKKTRSKNKYIALVLLFLSVGIFIINYYQTKEEFYTLFEPYYLERKYAKIANTSALSNTTTDLLQYRTKPILFGTEKISYDLAKLLSSLILSRNKITTIKLKVLDLPEELINKLTKNELTMALIPSPDVRKMGNKNLRFIANITHQYMFFISSTKAGLQYFWQIRTRRLGLPLQLKGIWNDIQEIAFSKGSSTILRFGDIKDLVKDLQEGKIDAIFYADRYPNDFLNNLLTPMTHEYQLIPMTFKNEDIFVKKYIQYSKSIVPLTYDYIPSMYLPTGVGRTWQSNYTPDYPTFTYDISLICTDKMDNFTGYEIAKTIYSGRKLLGRNRLGIHTYIGDPFTPGDITRPIGGPTGKEIQVQEGSKAFYLTKGMISYCKDPICMTAIGQRRCKACDPNSPETNLQWDSRVIAEKDMKLY